MPYPGGRVVVGQAAEPKIPELPAPIGVGIPQSFDIESAGQSSFDGCFDELGRKEGQ
jgi:hypothetical protein